MVLAGGSGANLWPKSRAGVPKPFVRWFGEESLFAQTVRRLQQVAPPEQIHAVLHRSHGALVREHVPEFLPDRIVLEPAARDTAACIGLAAIHLKRLDEDPVMVVVPGDHLIWEEEQFLAALQSAIDQARDGQRLLTVGVRPTRAEAGYGYIKTEPVAGKRSGYRVHRFIEKPGLSEAVSLLQEGDWLWNSGIFVCRISRLLKEMQRHLPVLWERLMQVTAVSPQEWEAALEDAYRDLPAIPIEQGLMEKSRNLWVVPGHFAWDDLSSWAVVKRIGQADANGNVASGEARFIQSSGNLVVSEEAKQVVTIGLKDVLVINTADALLVMDQTKASHLAPLLASKGEMPPSVLGEIDPVFPLEIPSAQWATPEGEVVRTVEKPWGREIWWAVTGRYVGKLIEVHAGHSLSLQYHNQKHESMLFVKGYGTMRYGEQEFDLHEGMTVTIPPHQVHRVMAHTDLVFFEVSTPEVYDVVRLEDVYGRALPERAERVKPPRES